MLATRSPSREREKDKKAGEHEANKCTIYHIKSNASQVTNVANDVAWLAQNRAKPNTSSEASCRDMHLCSFLIQGKIALTAGLFLRLRL